MKCVFCGKEIKGYGHNARPYFDGRCCDSCNEIIIATRLNKHSIKNYSDKGNCSRCLQCCTDFIPLTSLDIIRIKAYISTHKVERNVCHDEKGNFIMLCPFVSDKGCQIYSVRPEVCRGFNCWDSKEAIAKNKIKCTANAVVNNCNSFASLHYIFFDDETFNNKLIEAIANKEVKNYE